MSFGFCFFIFLTLQKIPRPASPGPARSSQSSARQLKGAALAAVFGGSGCRQDHSGSILDHVKMGFYEFLESFLVVLYHYIIVLWLYDGRGILSLGCLSFLAFFLSRS